jgi:hypothetical protein
MYYGGSPDDRLPPGIAILRMIAAVGILAYGIYCLCVTQIPLGEYRQSPGCVPGLAATATLPPCTDQPFQLVRAYNAGTSRHPDYYLVLQDSADATRTVRILDGDLYYEARRGDTLTAQMWRGKVLTVSDSTEESDTPDRPGSGTRTALIYIAVGILGVAWCLVQLPARTPRAKPIVPAGPETPPPAGKDYW